MNRRPPGLKLVKAIHGFLHLRQGGGSPQPPHDRRLRARPQHVALPGFGLFMCRAAWVNSEISFLICRSIDK